MIKLPKTNESVPWEQTRFKGERITLRKQHRINHVDRAIGGLNIGNEQFSAVDVDDADLLVAALPTLTRQTDVDSLYSDGGFGSPLRGKLPVRGLARVSDMLTASAMMASVRSILRYLQ